MKLAQFFLVLIGAINSICCSSMKRIHSKEPLAAVIERGLSVSRQQSLLLAHTVEDQEDKLPRAYEHGKLVTTSPGAWTSGFFAGTLWYLYGNAPSEEIKEQAERYTWRVERAKNITSHHDVGFMIHCSFGNAYRITNDPKYLTVMKTGAESLVTRFNADLGVIKSWNSRPRWQYPVIIDNMMNLEFLCFMGKKIGEENYVTIANSHAKKTLEHHFRPDYSSYHVVSYDTISGLPHAKHTHQGYAHESAWAPGQAWALYGYTMMFRETNKPEYLKLARQIASFIINHPNLPEDRVPYWDFDVPDRAKAPRDASAAAIMASALIELSQLDTTKDSSVWLDFAEGQIRSLSSPTYLAEPGTVGGFILKHSVGNHRRKYEVDMPITYADYYYVEALTRLKKLQHEN